MMTFIDLAKHPVNQKLVVVFRYISTIELICEVIN